MSNCRKLDCSYIVSGNAKWYNCSYWRIAVQFLMKLIIHLFYNTAILHKCPGEMEMYLQTSIDTQMFVKALAQ